MAILQVRDVDDVLYNALKTLAKKERRSLSQEVIKIIEEYISNPLRRPEDRTDAFLKIRWEGNGKPGELARKLRKARKSGRRFKKDVFD